ncbi:MAG TPA: hypothetical protein VF897_08865, partial [Roseiflexaceae bacterium]
IVSYHNGQLDGEYTRFCRAGKIAYHGFFKAGKPIGQKEEQNCDVDSKTITVISGQGKEIYLARYVNGVLREEIKKSTPNWEWSVFAANGSLELKRIGDQVVYQRNVPTIQTK